MHLQGIDCPILAGTKSSKNSAYPVLLSTRRLSAVWAVEVGTKYKLPRNSQAYNIEFDNTRYLHVLSIVYPCCFQMNCILRRKNVVTQEIELTEETEAEQLSWRVWISWIAADIAMNFMELGECVGLPAAAVCDSTKFSARILSFAWHFDSWRSLKRCFVANNSKTFCFVAETSSSAFTSPPDPTKNGVWEMWALAFLRWKLRWDILVGSLIIYRWIPLCHLKPSLIDVFASPFEIIWHHSDSFSMKAQAPLSSTIWLKGMKSLFVEAISF